MRRLISTVAVPTSYSQKANPAQTAINATTVLMNFPLLKRGGPEPVLLAAPEEVAEAAPPEVALALPPPVDDG